MNIVDIAPAVEQIIKEHHTYGAECIITELVYSMKKHDLFYRDGSGLVRMLIAAIRRAEEDENNGT